MRKEGKPFFTRSWTQSQSKARTKLKHKKALLCSSFALLGCNAQTKQSLNKALQKLCFCIKLCYALLPLVQNFVTLCYAVDHSLPLQSTRPQIGTNNESDISAETFTFAQRKFLHKLNQSLIHKHNKTKHTSPQNRAQSQDYRVLTLRSLDLFYGGQIKHKMIRPLLDFKRESITMVCKDFLISVYPDTSNRLLQYSRNRIRKQIIPSIKYFLNPQVENSLFKLAELLKKEESLVYSLLPLRKALIEQSS